jgi:hypothetical protein
VGAGTLGTKEKEMKALYKTRSGRIVFEVEGQSPKDVFCAIVEVQNIFEADSTCGCCESPEIQFRVRTIDSNEYFDLNCEGCTATLNFGQTKKGSLFPKRKDAEGMLLANRGWKVWRGLPPAEKTAGASARSEADDVPF